MKNKFFKIKKFPIKWILIIILIFSLGALSNYLYISQNKQQIKAVEKNDKYVSFLLEVYDNIKENYWNTLSDPQLANIYKLGTEKLTSRLAEKEPQDKKDLAIMLEKSMKDMDESRKKEFTVQLAGLVLGNLEPFGRSGLYTTKLEQDLKNRVQNIDPSVNLYASLNADKSSSSGQIEQAYEKESKELNKIVTDPSQSKEKKQDAQNKLVQVSRAHDTLSVPEKKENYDKEKIEATVTYKLIRPNIFYLRIKQMSPLTFDEFQKSLNSVYKQKGPDCLIIDLRANIGGAIDILAYFLGPFIGKNQYAYDFFHQGSYLPNKTQVGFLPSLLQYKNIVILIDNQTQSSAEVMASTLKKYKVGILVGTTTRGWGTVERVLPIKQQLDKSETYSMFLVHSLTLRDDNTPIEGKGVDPVINIKDQDWDKSLFSYIHYQELVDAVKEVVGNTN